ncbi:MAG: TRAP transporter substrate-binding protein [Beijerinckiaceae bacterium]
MSHSLAITRRVALAGAASLIAAPHVARAQSPVTLKLHHFLPGVATVPRNFLTPWAKKIEADSQGRLKIDIFNAMQLGGTPPQLYDQARDGVADIVWTLPGYTPNRFPKAEVFDLPFIAGNAEPTSKAAYSYYEKHLKDEFAGVRVLAVHTHGPGVIHVTGNGIRTLDDLKGKKLRVPTRMINKLVEKLGGIPVGMPVPQVPEALATRVIDGTVIPWEVTASLKVAELTKTHTNFTGTRGLYTTMFVLAMNPAKYDGLPADLRAILDANSGAAIAAQIGRVMDEGDKPALEIAQKRNNNIVTLDAAETAKWQERAKIVEAEWLAEAKGKGLAAETLLADAKALIAQHVGS